MTGPRENLRVLPDRDWPAADARSVGGKVAGLVRLAECGCPVPAGFCVTTGAYRSHVERALAGDGDGDDDGHRAVRPAAIRRRILDTPIPESLVDEIAEAFGALSAPAGLGPVAVRSSGTREDMPATAFAGLHDTTLNVRDLPTCLTAIRRCWASTWSDRAVAYGRERGLDPRDAGMAVIVQALVPAQVSGVLFSADPVTGDADRVVIESSWGLGESIVSGRVAPDRFVVSRRDWTIVETHVGDKRSECVPDPTPGGFGTIDRDVEPERRGRRTLSDEDILFLARTAVELERHAACPQDIEWARTPSGFVFLQARPITTARGHSSAPTGADDSQVWSNLNTAEVLPDVVSPMTWSVIGQLEPIWRRRACRLGLDTGDLPLIGLVAGRAYFNVTSMAAIGRSIPFARNVDIDMVLGGAGAASAGRPAELELAFDDLPKIRIRPLRTLVALPGLLVSCVRHHPRGATRQTAALAGWRRAAEARDLAGLSDPDLLELFDTALDELFRDEDLLMGPAVGMSYFLALRRACARWLGDDDGAIANALLAGQGGISSAESGHALWNLATLARRDDEVAAGLRAASTFAEARDELATSDGGRDFLAGWDEFLATHGHHTRGEVELLNPRWRERPDYVLALLRGYLESIDASDPIARYDAQALRCEENTEACRRRLRNPLKRAAFDLLLRKARAGAAVRENLKSEAMRYIALARRILLELGSRLQQRGVVAEPDDVFFAERTELPALVRESADLRSLIRSRRDAYERNSLLAPPPIVVGNFDAAQAALPPDVPATRVLRGIAASRGRARGPARVILRATEDEYVRPGEILVAPFTDPGWTPYFVTAAGIVMNTGGLLSHGSIVAREYGLPSVVNVGPATDIIRTGQMLEVDGDRGEVRILGDEIGPGTSWRSRVSGGATDGRLGRRAEVLVNLLAVASIGSEP